MANAVVFVNPVPSKAPQISAFKFLKVISPNFSQVSVISSNLDQNDDAQVINIRYKKQKNKISRVINFIWYQIKLFFKSMAIVEKGDYAFFWIGDVMFAPMLVCKLKGVKTYFFLYGVTSLENDSKKAKTTKKGQDYLSSKADYICAESASVLLDRSITLSDKTKIIHLYVDDMPALNDKEHKIGMICRLASGKCVLESIEGFCEFHKIHPQYTLEIVGDGILYEDCKNLIEELNAEDYVALHGWMLHEQLFKIMPHWELLLFPTKTEGMPNAVLESMSMGVPALCSYVGGIKDLIVDKHNGFILKNYDAESIKEALCEVVESDVTGCVSKNAKDTITAKFTLQKAQENFKLQMGF